MNIRKPVDYSELFVAVEQAVCAGVPQMDLYRELGRLVSERPEKGTAVAVSERLREMHPECSGFSPRNLRRMRDFYRLYEDQSDLMAQAMKLKWTQNVVIMEAELTMEERAWYLQACAEYGWSKSELQRKIESSTYQEVSLDQIPQVWYDKVNSKQETRTFQNDEGDACPSWEYLQESDSGVYDEKHGEENGVRKRFPSCLGSNQHRESWKRDLSFSATQDSRVWDTMRRTQCPSTDQSRLQRVRPPDWHGSGEYLRRLQG